MTKVGTLNKLIDGSEQPSAYEVTKEKVKDVYDNEKSKHEIFRKKSFIHYLLFFIILAVILYLIFYFFKFPFVQNKDLSGNLTGDVNQGRAIWTAILVSLIITVLAYLLMVPKSKW